MQSHWTAFLSKKQALPVVGVRGFEPPEALKKTWSPLRVVKSPLDAPCFFPASTRCIRRPSALVFAALAGQSPDPFCQILLFKSDLTYHIFTI